jgi:hypothetical protein
MTDTSHAPERNPTPKSLKSARHVSDMMALWALCEQPACRKLGRCRAVPLTCLKECIELVPDGAGAFVFALFEGKDEGLPFEEALARVPEELGEEWRNWHNAVTRITGRPSMLPRAKIERSDAGPAAGSRNSRPA